MSKDPRSLDMVSFTFSSATPNVDKIRKWIYRQNNVAESIKELIVVFGDEYNKWKEAQPPPVNEQRLTIYQRRRLSGLCTRCGQPATNGKSRCKPCLEKLKGYRESKKTGN